MSAFGKFSMFGLALVCALAPSVARGGTPASGSVHLNDASWTVADAIAYPEEDEISVTFADKVFDRKAFATDGKLDDFDVMRHGGQTLTLHVGKDGPTMCLDYSTGNGGGSTCNSDYPPTITIAARNADHIAGRMHYGDAAADHVHVDFDVPIQASLARSGKPLPADGGEPGQAVLRHFAAIYKGDIEQMKAQAHPERRKEMDGEMEAQMREMIGLVQAMTPKNVRITGGTVDGDSAIVDYVGDGDGSKVKGTADLERFEGNWYVSGTSNSSGD